MNTTTLPTEEKKSLEELSTYDNIYSKFEKAVLKFQNNKDIIKEKKEENEILIDEIRDLFEQLGSEESYIELASGGFAHVSKKTRIREVLDKEKLSNALALSVEDIKTPFDFSKLTQDGKLTPKLISQHTETNVKVSVTVRNKKNKPKQKKK